MNVIGRFLGRGRSARPAAPPARELLGDPVDDAIQARQRMTVGAYFAQSDAWHAVTSSNVHSVAFYGTATTSQPDAHGILGVRFKDKKTGAVKAEYRYSQVPVHVYTDMLDAGSKGKFVWSDLRGKYPFGIVR